MGIRLTVSAMLVASTLAGVAHAGSSSVVWGYNIGDAARAPALVFGPAADTGYGPEYRFTRAVVLEGMLVIERLASPNTDWQNWLASAQARGASDSFTLTIGSPKASVYFTGVRPQSIREVITRDASGQEQLVEQLVFVVDKLGADHLQKKHIANVKYEDISVQRGIGMSEQFYKWIQDSFDHKYSRRNGAIVSADYDHDEQSRLEFKEGLITEFGMPALDASSKDAALMTIKFAPEMTRQVLKKGGAITGDISAKVQKLWHPSNFRLHIEGLDDLSVKVNKIEALTIKQKVTENGVGEEREYEKVPTSVEIPNLVITYTGDWQEQLIIDGDFGDGEGSEKTATLKYLADFKSILFELHFFNLGVFKVTPDKVEAGTDNIRRVTPEYKGPVADAQIWL